MNIQKKYISNIAKELLFEAWISPDMTIEPITKIESNPVVGGDFKLYAESESGTWIMSGKFKEIVWNEKLKYTWYWEGTDEKTEITVDFTKASDYTIVELEHVGFLNEESKEMHDTGWDSYFKGLEEKINEER